MSEADVRLTAWVHGRVQGVGFRWWTRCRALELGLTGYAANLADGRVLVVAQGRCEAGEKLLQLLEETLELDLSGLSEVDKERLLVVAERAIDLVCTVGRTLKSGTTVNFEVADVGS